MRGLAFKVRVDPATIKRHSEWQTNWDAIIPGIKRRAYICDPLPSMLGDAPKDFIRVKEYVPNSRPTKKLARWTPYIAKVGSKNYPLESITEQLLTRIGMKCHVPMANSRLARISGQIRFLSKYFLKGDESLVHGLEIFSAYLDDDDMIAEIADKRAEPEFYTVQAIEHALQFLYPGTWQEIFEGVCTMIAFDALTGNHDRHPLNWGIIAPVHPAKPIRFAPIFDTARALFWNHSEASVVKIDSSRPSFETYLEKSVPQIGWDNRTGLNHFDLISAICGKYSQLRHCFQRVFREQCVDQCCRMVDEEFSLLMSRPRRHLICRCLHSRLERCVEATK